MLSKPSRIDHLIYLSITEFCIEFFSQIDESIGYLFFMDYKWSA